MLLMKNVLEYPKERFVTKKKFKSLLPVRCINTKIYLEKFHHAVDDF